MTILFDQFRFRKYFEEVVYLQLQFKKLKISDLKNLEMFSWAFRGVPSQH